MSTERSEGQIKAGAWRLEGGTLWLVCRADRFVPVEGVVYFPLIMFYFPIYHCEAPPCMQTTGAFRWQKKRGDGSLQLSQGPRYVTTVHAMECSRPYEYDGEGPAARMIKRVFGIYSTTAPIFFLYS